MRPLGPFVALATALALTGCSVAGSQGDCGARTQSIVSSTSAPDIDEWTSEVQKVKGATGLGHWGALTGGILEFEPQLDDAVELGVQGKVRCTVSLEPGMEGSSMHVFAWTAEHCLAPFLSDGLRVHVWVPAARAYRDVAIRRVVDPSFRRFEQAFAALPAEERARAKAKLWDGNSRARERAVGHCLDAHAKAALNASTEMGACSTILDLARFEIEPLSPWPADVEAALKTEASRLADDRARMKEKLESAPFLSPDIGKGLVEWNSSVQTLSDLRASANVASVAGMFPSLADAARDLGPGDPSVSFEKRLDDAEAGVSRVFGALRQFSGVEDKMLLHFNWRSEASASGQSGLSPEGAKGYGAVPLHEVSGSGKSKSLTPVVVDGREIGVLVSVPRSAARARFERGDSGGLFSMFGIASVVVLTTVDGEPTSGGIPLRRMPSRRDGGKYEASGKGTKERGNDASKSAPDQRGKQASNDGGPGGSSCLY